jgi:hypothetical protein
VLLLLEGLPRVHHQVAPGRLDLRELRMSRICPRPQRHPLEVCRVPLAARTSRGGTPSSPYPSCTPKDSASSEGRQRRLFAEATV